MSMNSESSPVPGTPPPREGEFPVDCLRGSKSHGCHLQAPLAALAFLLLLLQGVNLVALLGSDAPSSALLGLHLLLTLLALGLVGLVFHVARRDLQHPLNHVRTWAQQMRNGQLSARIPASASGEFSVLAQDINNLSDKLETLSLDMQNQVEQQTHRIQLKTHSLEILYDVAASINASRDLDDLLTRFLHTLKDVVHAEAATVRMLTDDGQMRLLAHTGLDAEVVAQEALIPVNRCLCGQALQEGTVLAQGDTKPCSKFAGRPFFAGGELEMIAVPLQYRGKVLGVYNLFTNEKDLVRREDMQELLTSIGHHLGMAIEKARLDEEANLLSIMEERTRLAHELHDSLAQSLASLRFQVRVLDETLHEGREEALWEELERIENSLDEAYIELRELIAHFRAPMDKRGLIPAVEQAVKRFRRETDIHTFLQQEWANANLPADTEMQVLRIIQESLANIRKHSQANTVRVMLKALPKGEFQVLVEDDGVGMGEPVSGAPGEHVGLKILQERATRIGGKLRIESEPGEGTRILLRFNHPPKAAGQPITLTPRALP
jgi:two-component system, NarL family, nitrate/nitrite sensor histidine kinase NarX